MEEWPGTRHSQSKMEKKGVENEKEKEEEEKMKSFCSEVHEFLTNHTNFRTIRAQQQGCATLPIIVSRQPSRSTFFTYHYRHPG